MDPQAVNNYLHSSCFEVGHIWTHLIGFKLGNCGYQTIIFGPILTGPETVFQKVILLVFSCIEGEELFLVATQSLQSNSTVLFLSLLEIQVLINFYSL